MGNRGSSQGEAESRLPPSGRAKGRTEGVESTEEGEEVEAELPPPMRPISSLPPSEESNKVIKTLLKNIYNYILNVRSWQKVSTLTLMNHSS